MLVSNRRHFLCLAAALIPSIANANCDSNIQVLFQSNAYADSLSGGESEFQGGSVIATQSKWDQFLQTFKPNHEGESLARTEINFDEEQVVIGTYGTSATCLVEIDDVRLNCDLSGVSTSLKIEMDVFDASLGCDIKCMALGQVVYAVAVPLEWEIDTNNIIVEATGPCVEMSTTSSTEEVFQKFELVQYTLELECGSGECLSPNGTCAGEVSCFVDPCDVNECGDGEYCTSNYCGGCHAVCAPADIDGATTSPISKDPSAASTDDMTSPTTTTSSMASTEDDLISEILLDTTTSSTVVGPITTDVSLATTDDDLFGEILLDTTTTTDTVGSTQDNSGTITGSGSINISFVPESVDVPTDSDLCDQIRVVYDSSALSRYLVPDGKSGTSVTTVYSQDQMDELLAGFIPMSSDGSTTGLENIDYSLEQVIFSTYYESSTCNAELVSANFTCEGTTISIGMTVLDESAGCDMACDAEGQVVYAIVTPPGADASLDTIVNGPCLDSPTIDSVTIATQASVLETETTQTVPSTTSSSTEAPDTELTTNPASGQESGNVPEGIPRENASTSSSLSPLLLFGGYFVHFHLSWRL